MLLEETARTLIINARNWKSRWSPTRRKSEAVAAVLEVSGLSGEDVGRALKKAWEDMQYGVAVVDVIEHHAQHMLANIYRSTPEVAPEIRKFLVDRQEGQRARLAEYIEWAFDVRTTAKETKAYLEEVVSVYETAGQNSLAMDVKSKIEQIDLGKQQASRKRQPEDTVKHFKELSKDKQQAFRIGYADAYISRIKNHFPGKDATQWLMSDKFKQEASDMAIDPYKMNRRIDRENTMFETARIVLEDSKTNTGLINMED